MLDHQQVQGQLPQAAPDIDLVGIVVARGKLLGTDDGGIGVGVSRAAVGGCACAVGAAVCLLAVEPDQPGAVDFLHRRDLAGQNIGHRAFLVGADCHVVCRSLIHNHVQRFGQRCAIFCRIDQLSRKVFFGLHIDAGHGGGGLHISRVQHTGRVLHCGQLALAVKRQNRDIFRQDHLGSAVVGGVFHLQHDRHNGIVLAVLHRHCDGQAVRVEGIGIHAAGALIGEQAFGPQRQADPGIAGGNRQAIAAHVVAGGGIRQIAVEDFVHLVVIGRCAGILGQFRLLHRQLHRGDQCGQGGVGGLDFIALLFFFGDGVVQIFGRIHRCGSFIRSGDSLVQRSFQISVVRVGLPGGAGNGPLSHSGQNRPPVQRVDGIDERLGFRAKQRRFGGGRLRRGRGGHSRGRRAALLASLRSGIGQKRSRAGACQQADARQQSGCNAVQFCVFPMHIAFSLSHKGKARCIFSQRAWGFNGLLCPVRVPHSTPEASRLWLRMPPFCLAVRQRAMPVQSGCSFISTKQSTPWSGEVVRVWAMPCPTRPRRAVVI